MHVLFSIQFKISDDESDFSVRERERERERESGDEIENKGEN